MDQEKIDIKRIIQKNWSYWKVAAIVNLSWFFISVKRRKAALRKVKMIEKRIIGDRGFTLIELLIVMIILGLLASLVGPKMFGKVDKAKIKTAKVQIELFSAAIDSFRLDMGRFPSSLGELRHCKDTKWDGPYLPKEIPLDPWNNPYIYKNPGEHGPYDIISYGADSKPMGEGNDKDIVSWE